MNVKPFAASHANANREKIKEINDLALVRPLVPIESVSSKQRLEDSKRVPTL